MVAPLSPSQPWLPFLSLPKLPGYWGTQTMQPTTTPSRAAGAWLILYKYVPNHCNWPASRLVACRDTLNMLASVGHSMQVRAIITAKLVHKIKWQPGFSH